MSFEDTSSVTFKFTAVLHFFFQNNKRKENFKKQFETQKMELSNLEKLNPLSGNSLNIEEVSGLEVAMLQRKREENLNGKLLFWGKFYGVTQDYLIVVLIDTTSEYPNKKYYYW